jgi:hypothetical protein
MVIVSIDSKLHEMVRIDSFRLLFYIDIQLFSNAFRDAILLLRSAFFLTLLYALL